MYRHELPFVSLFLDFCAWRRGSAGRLATSAMLQLAWTLLLALAASSRAALFDDATLDDNSLQLASAELDSVIGALRETLVDTGEAALEVRRIAPLRVPAA